jgi:SAM-dependent MidA family methyltransferase
MPAHAPRASLRVNEDLLRRIVAEIEAAGPIPFSRFMELALYDPTHGFFQLTAPGPDGHFVTAPHVSHVFIDALSVAAERARTAVGEGAIVVDVGAGDGTLLAGLAQATGMRAIGVDRSEAARVAMRARNLTPAADIPSGIRGFVICNELFDNLPFDLVDRERGAPIEIEARDGALVATGPLERARPVLGAAARSMILALARSVERGYVMIIDYADPEEPVRGYAGHRPVEDLLEAPGEADITGPVDLDTVAALASDAGLVVQARTTQRDLLHAFGYREALTRLQAEQNAARAAGDHVKEVALWNARGEATMLVDPQGMGGYGVLVLGTEGLPPLLD